MKRFMRVCLFSSLALGVCLLASPISRGDDPDEKEEKENIAAAKKLTDPVKKLVEAVEGDKDIARAAAELNKKGDLKHIMWAAFKSRERGGLGVGEKKKTDGVEPKLISEMRRKNPMSADDLKEQSADLIKIANIAKAIGEIAELHTPEKNDPKNPDRTVANWKKFTKREKDGAQELIDAVKANDPAKVSDATKNLYSSCTNCHIAFR
jgi:cytochrome c556